VLAEVLRIDGIEFSPVVDVSEIGIHLDDMMQITAGRFQDVPHII
jgi:hypothetical protein